MDFRVCIALSDRGWIFERAARELAERLPYVTVSNGPDPSADIVYYLNYAARKAPAGTLEIAYFAHLEQAPEASERFFSTAAGVDHCVCHAQRYADLLRARGVQRVSVISPGVDVDRFAPRLRVGVVGRTYHTGRKGEELVARVLDTPGIEWVFTGEGWPLPAVTLTDDEMPGFYRSLDYLLVPSLYEGGPMSVVEALACGTPVIAPDVGWVREFPHIEYSVGDAEDLRRVLIECAAQKQRLADAARPYTWDAWAKAHDQLFRSLMAAATAESRRRSGIRGTPMPAGVGVGIYLHGDEAQSLGGPSVRIPALAQTLALTGCRAALRNRHTAPDPEDQVVHVVNCWRPDTALALLRGARAGGRNVIFSPIYLDLSLARLWGRELLRAAAAAETATDLDDVFARLHRIYRDPDMAAHFRSEPQPGFHERVRDMVGLADHVILLSRAEGSRLSSIGASPKAASIVMNAAPVPAADPGLFARYIGFERYVLCVGRLEPRKNQLALLHALRNQDLPVVLIGHSSNAEYRELLERWRPRNLRILDRLPSDSPLLASAYAGATVQVLPSWAEGGPLAALQAAQYGTPVVVSEGWGGEEYFGDWAAYCDPSSPDSIKDAVLRAAPWRDDAERTQRQRAAFHAEAAWHRHVEATQDVYRSVIGVAPPRPGEISGPVAVRADCRPQRRGAWLFDLTTTLNRSGRWTGIARVEHDLARALLANRPDDGLRFVRWLDGARRFIRVTPLDLERPGTVEDWSSAPDADLTGANRLVVCGSAWMQNAEYVAGVRRAVSEHSIGLSVFLHDLFPLTAPHWYPEGYARIFRQNLTELLEAADGVICPSDATRLEVMRFLASHPSLPALPVTTVREGTPLTPLRARAGRQLLPLALRGRTYVLAVGAIHARKNYGLLYSCWVSLASALGPRCPTLVVVGGLAWNGADVARAMLEDPRVSDHILLLEDVDDDQLAALYRGAALTAYPSLAEGWGLPVAESLAFGKLCLAGDTPAVREIAPELVELLDPLDVRLWTTRIRYYVEHPTAIAERERLIAAAYRPTTWAESAAQLQAAVATHGAVHPAMAHYTCGVLVRPRYDGGEGILPVFGWRRTEDDGVEADGARSRLRVRLPAAPQDDLVACLELLVPDELHGVQADIHIAGRLACRWWLRAGHQSRYAVLVPASAAADGDIDVDLAWRTEAASLGEDRGIRLVTVRVASPDALDCGAAEPASDALANSGVSAFDPAFARVVMGQAAAPLPGWGIPARGYSLQMALPLDVPLDQMVQVDIHIRANLAGYWSAMRLEIAANSYDLGQVVLRSSNAVVIRLDIAPRLRAGSDPLILNISALGEGPNAAGRLDAQAPEFPFAVIGLRSHRPSLSPRRRVPCVVNRKVYLLPPCSATSGATNGGHAAPGLDWLVDPSGREAAFSVSALLPLRCPREARSPLMVALELRAEEGTSAVEVFALAGDRLAGRATMEPGGVAVLVAAIPQVALGSEGELDLFLVARPAGVAPRAEAALVDLPLVSCSSVYLCRAASEPVLEKAPAELLAPAVPLCLSEPRPESVDQTAVQPDDAGDLLLDLTTHGDPRACLLSGWFEPEIDGTWTHADHAQLKLEVPADAGLVVAVDCRVYGIEYTGPAHVRVFADGNLLQERVFPTPDWTEMSFVLPDAIVAKRSHVTLSFMRINGVSPAKVGESDDTRHLGLLIRSVRVRSTRLDESSAIRTD